MQRWILIAAAGAIAGSVAAAVFLVLHAVVVVPLWSGILSGIAMAMLAGAIIACGVEIVGRGAAPPSNALLLGFLLWSALLPATFIAATVHDRVYEPVEIGVAVAATVLYGAAVGFHFGERRVSAAVAGGLIAIAMLIRAGGPLTHFESRRAVLMFAGLLPVTIVYAIALVAAMRITRPAG